MPSAMTLAALFAVVAVYAAYRAIAALRWREGGRFWAFLGATLPLSALAVVLLSIGIRHPSPNEPFADNIGFGPDWSCSVNDNGARVCLHDQQKPAAASTPAEQ